MSHLPSTFLLQERFNEGAEGQRFDLFFRKHENNCLLGLKNAKDMIINHIGPRVVKGGKD